MCLLKLVIQTKWMKSIVNLDSSLVFIGDQLAVFLSNFLAFQTSHII
jgi:hypothetical protein